MKNKSLLRSNIVGLPVGFIVGGLCVAVMTNMGMDRNGANTLGMLIGCVTWMTIARKWSV